MSSMHAFAHGSSSESSGDEDDFFHPSTDPHADEFADYNPRKRRRTGRDAKESAALGVFGSESEDEVGPGKRWKKKDLRSKGMSFVSTGQHKLDKDEDEDEEDDEPAEEEDVNMDDAEEEEETAAPRGLGFGAKGLGFQSPAVGKKINNAPKNSTPLGRGFVPSSAAAPILLNNGDDDVSTPRIGKGTKGAPSGANAGSFAARMMAKMGYKEGEGLGKEGTGRASVIEVTLRPQGEIEEEKRQAKLRGEKYEDSDEEKKKKRRKARTAGIESGSGSGMSTPRKAQKPKFRTLEEVQRAAPGLQIPEAFAPILDMTAPGQRLLTSTSGLLTPTTGIESVEQIESKKLARRAQNDLSAYVEEWKNLEERKAYIEMTIVQQQQELDEEQLEFDRMKSFADTVQSISQAVKDFQWDPVIEALTSADVLVDPGPSKTNEELSSIAVAAVHPFLRQATEGWQPLEDPKLTGIAPQLFKIRHILGVTSSNEKSLADQYLRNDGSHRIHSKSTSAYESMIYKIIFPKVVSAINQSWDVYDPTPLQALFDAWEGLLPSFVRSQILDQAVVGKLNQAVSSWNPKKKRTHELPHLWLFPWLQYLPAHHADPKSSTGLVSDVKRKFRQLVDTWDFRKGVVPGLQQWREVLCPSPSNDQWTPLIMNHVIPSMARFLKNEKNFMVDPNDQSPYVSSLQGVFAWKDILKPRIVGQVIADTVFPMWHNVLHQWLTVVGPNEEIGQWFEWWRDEVFPDDIKNLKSIRDEFEKGHEMINQALDLGSKASTMLPAPPQTQRISMSSPAPITPAKPAAPVVEETTFRHRVEDWCIENDLQFLPEKKVLHSAGPLYRITAAGNGKNGTLVYFKGDSLLAISKKGAEQVDIRINWENADARDALLEMAWYNVK
ncbi:putative G-patch domain-containing protein [Mollisia scopiformis]|uniref:Putative G-patch domain-containing protein n=1 Tax=Mollisia scopiformis TaxID=149040 RepID=A0A132B251_MOLSC|nr:putative G-patch domain-containing protein [Mollisia scopiformis]KUJ06466.1 putative G-patch domain-containing protein [Mollisia scopiformis]